MIYFLLTAHSGELDLRQLPSPRQLHAAFYRNDFILYKKLLVDSRITLEHYAALEPIKKKQLLRDWLANIQDCHKAFSKAFQSESVSDGYNINKLGEFDLSKIDVILLSGRQTLVFHPTELYLKVFYNFHTDSDNQLKIVSEIKNWPKELSSFNISPTWMAYMDVFSFQPELNAQSIRLQEWIKTPMLDAERPTWRSLIIDKE